MDKGWVWVMETKLHAYATSAMNGTEGSIWCTGPSFLTESDANTHSCPEA
jgi:hypothetical protein